MIKSGLVSVTFRELPPEQIINLVQQAQMDGIEWGGDIHVPHGDLKRARRVRQLTEDAGLKTAAYGSYHRIHAQDDDPFKSVLETAQELNAPTIRLWAGTKASADADQQYRNLLVERTQQFADLAAKANITLAFEYHGQTLTDDPNSAKELLQKINRPNVKTYWQPLVHLNHDQQTTSLNLILPWLGDIHVYAWNKDHQRFPLSDHTQTWLGYLKQIPTTANRFAMIEFVKNDQPDQFQKDAKTLKSWLNQINSPQSTPTD